ncbi:hypothetical protein [Corynebacterium hadale]|uniref:hypothetical protein n=1 Tax=Corynebacterium hadale TaxID=2026255 RepID=UPI00105523E2|nr:hypothetical protein [Corynebacterium hadale]
MEPNKNPDLQWPAAGGVMQISDMIGTAVKLADLLINAANAGRAETARIEMKRQQLRHEHEQIVLAMRYIQEERTGLFEQYFDRLDKALDKGEADLAITLLANIKDLAAKAPFESLQDIRAVKANLADSEHEWRL